jgi:hypothetical protein
MEERQELLALIELCDGKASEHIGATGSGTLAEHVTQESV